MSSPSASHGRHHGANILIVTAVIALCITAWRFFTPLSGVTDSGGAITTMLAEVALIILGFLLLKTPAGGFRCFILFLSWAGVIGTFIAALFLHGWWTAAVIAVAALGVVIETFAHTPTRSL